MAQTLALRLEIPQTPLVEKTVALLRRELRERGQVDVTVQSTGTAGLVLGITPGIGTEGYRIESDHGACRITGNDERGLLYGVGKYLRGCRFGKGCVAHTEWRGTSVPKRSTRGIYFATHFGNYYHTAPLPDVIRYVEELALWGCNSLCVWFDMHHYTGIDDPAAQSMTDRLHAILQAANRVGMGASLLMLANEAYSTSPKELRAEPFPHHYHVELCPAKPEGLELILRWRRQMLERFADLTLDYIGIWPYDQGGCKCPDCSPWGGNGYVRVARELAKMVRSMFPASRIFVSAWEFGYWFGDAEWELFYKELGTAPDWADAIMAEGHGDFPPYVLKHGKPGGLPLLNFPEISMSGMYPWGGFGANLQPKRLQKVWDTCKSMLAGGFPYSEGIFEDINKVVCLQLYWDADRPVLDTLREYASYEFSPESADALADAMFAAEAGMSHTLVEKWQEAIPETGLPATPIYRLGNTAGAASTFATVQAADAGMDTRARSTWRWRLFYLRCVLDAELAASGGVATPSTERHFEEIRAIIHADDAVTTLCVNAPSVEALRRLLKRQRANIW